MSAPFVPDDFEVPLALATDRFRLEPLGPEYNERDHEAWMSSIAHIRATPGFPDGKWPTEMSAEQNLADLVRHAGDFAARTGFTYSVLDGNEVIGLMARSAQSLLPHRGVPAKTRQVDGSACMTSPVVCPRTRTQIDVRQRH